MVLKAVENGVSDRQVAQGRRPRKRRFRRQNTRKSKPSPPPDYAAHMITMATQNLIDVVAVAAVSGAVLLGLLGSSLFEANGFADEMLRNNWAIGRPL
jgi:hypothetical protein